MDTKHDWIDLSDLQIEDVEVLSQEGGRGIPEFAASSAQCACSCCPPTCSCSAEEGKGSIA